MLSGLHVHILPQHISDSTSYTTVKVRTHREGGERAGPPPLHHAQGLEVAPPKLRQLLRLHIEVAARVTHKALESHLGCAMPRTAMRHCSRQPCWLSDSCWITTVLLHSDILKNDTQWQIWCLPAYRGWREQQRGGNLAPPLWRGRRRHHCRVRHEAHRRSGHPGPLPVLRHRIPHQPCSDNHLN